MGKLKKDDGRILEKSGDLFGRVARIIEESRASVVRSVNHAMLAAYWLIGREIVEELQQGGARAEYGKQLVEELSAKLTKQYGKGFSAPSLWNFRQFYQIYADRELGILSLPGRESNQSHILSLPGRESNQSHILSPTGRELEGFECGRFKGDSSTSGFSSGLSWSHYRALMRVKNPDARRFYEEEAAACGWSKIQLERQIHTAYYERILKNHEEPGLTLPDRERLQGETRSPIDLLKSPYVLEFLDLPDDPALHERQLEAAVISHLQTFLLELGRGFAFVARQKRMRYEDTDLYVDLVFYNCILKCYVLIDLKIGEFSHQDVGQMDSYVRMFEDLYTASDDNPTVGLILCTEKNEAVARYSVLNDREKIFASKYMLYLPTEKELADELKKERRLIEERLGLLAEGNER